MTLILYILGDADRVRTKIEGLLLTGKLEALKQFSDTLTASISVISQQIQKVFSGEVLMAGGDDILFRVPQDKFSKGDLELISQQFASKSGCTISFGVADDIETAYINLRHAKAEGGSTIVISSSVI